MSCHPYMALRAGNTSRWYLDSGCSKHMTVDKSLFTHLAELNDGRVIFGDGNSTRIVEKGTVDVPGIPKLNDVLYVEGLKHNLINISQICDKGYDVYFAKDKCEIKNKKGKKYFVIGLRTSDNCYIIKPTKNNLRTCLISHSKETALWHQRLGHLNFKDLARLSRKSLVRHLPSLNKVDNPICKSCQMGKQSKASHKKRTQIGSSRPLELLHMDLA